MGYYMIVYLAALQGISKELYEAASLDGATGWKKLKYITIPMLKPTTFFVVIMLTIQCFKVFDLIYIVAGKYGHVQRQVMVRQGITHVQTLSRICKCRW